MTPELRFHCRKGCTRCCEGKGFVYLTVRDVERAASFLGLPQSQFETQYVVRSGHILRLRQNASLAGKAHFCVFLTESGCSIHPAKPLQCKSFPFWPEIIEESGRWEATAEWCPGIGMGRLVQIGTAHERAQRMRNAFLNFYSPK